jgi:hypothetical protein
MTSSRQRLPQRRASTTFDFRCNGLDYTASVSFFPGTDRLAEVFLSNAKVGSHSDAAAKDSAVLASLCLQHGVSVQVIKHALLRNADGSASSPLGCALDVITKETTP